MGEDIEQANLISILGCRERANKREGDGVDEKE